MDNTGVGEKISTQHPVVSDTQPSTFPFFYKGTNSILLGHRIFIRRIVNFVVLVQLPKSGVIYVILGRRSY